MKSSRSTAFYIVAGLFAIGVLVNVLSKPSTFLLPLLIFGGIFLLYKYPPGSWRSRGGSRPASRPGSARKPKSRNASFRVIRGSKDDNDPPRYH